MRFPKTSKTLVRSAVCLVAASLLGASARAEDLPKDDNNVYGQFDNGVKYIIRPCTNPPGRVAAYLHIATGALNEKDDANGLAHFMEHMAFNGSTHFPPGTLIPELNKLGMIFGQHTNAHTNTRETVYKLTLTDAKTESIERAMTILEDWANGISLVPAEVDNERGVILEESRARKSAGQRLNKLMLDNVFAGTRMANHDVIGKDDQIKVFKLEQFKDYYDTYYRPEVMTLIVVGDVKPADIVPIAQKHLGTFTARAPKVPNGTTEVKPTAETKAYVFTDPEQVQASLELTTVKPGRPVITTYEQYREEVVEAIGNWALNRRMQDLVTTGKATFLGAGVGVSDLENELTLSTLEVSGEPKDWNKMLDQLVSETSRGIQYGITSGEMALAKTSILSRAERAVQTEPTQSADQLVNSISRDIGQKNPLLSAKQELELTKRALASITPEEVKAKIVSNFKNDHWLIVANMPTSPTGVSLPTQQDILAATSAAWNLKVDAPKDAAVVAGLMETIPAAGKVAQVATDDELKITTATFENGTVFHHRYMDYKKDQVLISIRIAGGKIEEKAGENGLSDVGGLVLNQEATSKLSSTQIRDLMTGKNVRVGGGIGLDAMSLSVSGAPKDLEAGMQLAHALITDGKLEPAAVEEWRKRMKQALKLVKTQAGGLMQEAMTKTFMGNDSRVRMMTESEVDAVDPVKAEAWFKRIASTGSIEVTVIGDIQLEDAQKLVATYVGSLNRREKRTAEIDALRKLARPTGPWESKVAFKSETPKAMVLAGVQGVEEMNVVDRRLLSLAARVLSDRMIKRIREEERLVYSIGAGSQASRGIEGTGMFMAQSTTDPEKADKLADTIIEMFKDFAGAKGPTADEITVAKEQLSKNLETQMKEPSFWLTQLSDLDSRGRSLDELKSIVPMYASFTADKVHEAVAKYVKEDRLLRFVVVPEGAPATQPTAAAGAAPVMAK